MKRREEITQSAKNRYPYIKGLPQSTSYQAVFIEAAEWADKTMIDKFLYWLTTKSPFIDNKDMDKAIVELKKYLEE